MHVEEIALPEKYYTHVARDLFLRISSCSE